MKNLLNNRRIGTEMGYKSEQGDIAGLKADPVTLFPTRGGGLKEPPRGNDDCSITHACIDLKLLDFS